MRYMTNFWRNQGSVGHRPIFALWWEVDFEKSNSHFLSCNRVCKYVSFIYAILLIQHTKMIFKKITEILL